MEGWHTYYSQLTTLEFYGWWQVAVCLFAFLGLMAIWYHIGRKQQDFGQVFLAFSILCWSISGSIDVYYTQKHQEAFKEIITEHPNPNDENLNILANEILTQNNSQQLAWNSILSLINSLLILLALPWFRYIPKKIQNFIQSEYWIWIVGLPFVIVLLPSISTMITGRTYDIISELDVYYAILTLFFLGWVLWESFAQRRLKFLAYLSAICILVTFAAQILKLTTDAINMTLFSAIFKTTLIMIFFALALSWVKELAENIFPSSDHLFLYLTKRKTDNGKYRHIVSLKGLPGKDIREIIFTPGVYDLLKKFVEKKKEGDGWLEIRPKNEKRSGRSYDIQDYNEIKRIITTMLDGLFGKNNWSKSQHFEPLKGILFEMPTNRERKIRLKIPPENIEFIEKQKHYQ